MLAQRKVEISFSGLTTGARARIFQVAAIALSVLLSACGGGDTSTSAASLPLEPQFNDTSSSTLGVVAQQEELLIPESVQPAGIDLQILEDTSISSFFALLGTESVEGANDPVFRIIAEPENGTLVHVEGERAFTYIPARNFVGIDSFEYGFGDARSAVVNIEVINLNDPPILFADILPVIQADTEYVSVLEVSDPDVDSHLYQAFNLPQWLSLNSSTGELIGTPSSSDIGFFNDIEFSATDLSGQVSFVFGVSIEVLATNDAPFINVDQFPTAIDAGELVQVNLFPDDPNGDPVEVDFESNDLLDIRVDGGTVSVRAEEVSEVTDVELVLIARDIRGGVSSSSVPFRLHPVNETGNGRTLYGRNDSGVGIHLVVLGDGYREEQQAQFREHVENLVGKMLEDEGMGTHFPAWNVHMVETASEDSGIDDNLAVDVRNTVFDTGYFCKGVRRLICGDQAKMFGVAIDEYPNFDQILLLVNDSRFGGSGGQIAISSSEFLEIALHEMGHTIAGLADEYVDQYIPDTILPPYVEGQFANVSVNADAADVPWRHWFDGELGSSSILPEPSVEVGVFEGGYYREAGYFRPTQDSLMRNYNGKLGPVNSEQWVLEVYEKVEAIVDISPIATRLNIPAGETIEFSVQPTFDESLQTVEWYLDSRIIPDSGTDRPSVALNFPEGEYEVAVTVRDISGLIRKPEPHAGVFNYQWSVVVE